MAYLLAFLLNIIAPHLLHRSVAGSSICPNQMLSCSSLSPKACESFAVFSAEAPFQSLMNISRLFNVDTKKVSSANNISAKEAMLDKGQQILIPIKCECMDRHYQSFLRYEKRDTRAEEPLPDPTRIFQGLIACKLLEKQRNPNRHKSKEILSISLRCGCPTLEQGKQGFKNLVTYPLKKGDTLERIAQIFNSSAIDILKANGLKGLVPSVVSVFIPVKRRPTMAQLATNSKLLSTTHPVLSKPKRKKQHSKLAIDVGIVVAALIAASASATAVFLKKRRRNSPKPSEHESTKPSSIPRSEDGSASGILKTLNKKSGSLNESPLAIYTADQILKATENFNPSYRIGGCVYHGLLNGTPVAIKQTRAEISEEFKFWEKIQHPNLIRLLGICKGENREERHLVFEFAENGCLSDWLHGGLALKNRFIQSSSRFLTWRQRLQISLDVAQGLDYIHTHIQTSYVHKKINSSNVLLTADFRAKISNHCMPKSTEMFDKVLEEGEYNADEVGYMAPEYLSKGLLTRKTDIYAFGVLLVEVLSGKPPALSQGSICALALPGEDADVQGWMDPSLNDEYSVDDTLCLLNLAKDCVQRESSQRPAMDEIVSKLVTLIENLAADGTGEV